MKLLFLQLIALSTQLAPQEYLDRWAKNLFIEYTVVNNLVRTSEFDFPAGKNESAFEFKISMTNTGEEDLSMNPHWAIYFYHRIWFSSLISEKNHLLYFRTKIEQYDSPYKFYNANLRAFQHRPGSPNRPHRRSALVHHSCCQRMEISSKWWAPRN